MKKYFALLLATLMICSILSSVSAANKPEYTIIFATGSAADPENPQNVGTYYFEKLVEERSNGRIDVEPHIASSLGTAREIVEGVQLGTIQMGDVENGPMDSFVQECALWNLPYLYTSLEEAHNIQASDIGKNIQAQFEKIGIKHLAFNDGGFRYFTNSKHPIKAVSDFSGLKIRVMESPIYIGMVESLGGSAVPIAFAELYTALQQGTVDGQENPLDLIYAQSYFEVQDYISLSEHLYYPRQHIINLDFYNSLPEDLQQIIAESAIDACAYQNEYYKQYTEKMLDALVEKGMKVSEFDKEAAIKATSAIWPNYYKMIGGGDAAEGEKIVNRIAGGEFR